MADAYTLAKNHLNAGIQEAAENNIDLNAYVQALVWKLIERYKESGRSAWKGTDESAFSRPSRQ